MRAASEGSIVVLKQARDPGNSKGTRRPARQPTDRDPGILVFRSNRSYDATASPHKGTPA
jgi:hypothetical protein